MTEEEKDIKALKDILKESEKGGTWLPGHPPALFKEQIMDMYFEPTQKGGLWVRINWTRGLLQSPVKELAPATIKQLIAYMEDEMKYGKTNKSANG